MAPSLDVFRLIHFTCAECNGHYLLARVTRPGYRNAIQADEDLAHEVEKKKFIEIKCLYEDKILKRQCPHAHRQATAGLFENEPIGDELYEDHGQEDLRIWIAATKYGAPWVIIGTGRTEDEFWDELFSDPVLSRHEPEGPAQEIQACFMTEQDMDAMKDG